MRDVNRLGAGVTEGVLFGDECCAEVEEIIVPGATSTATRNGKLKKNETFASHGIQQISQLKCIGVAPSGTLSSAAHIKIYLFCKSRP